MQINQLQQSLHQDFSTDRHRLVYWYDAGHFSEALDELSLDGVQVLNMAGMSTSG
ncbi:hypothetical protein QLQ85_14545 [Halomonas sp. M4R5S39]|uniref:hypothetical protein n=1 Tax=Halomonas kalidii TaxID=3043293 RepID=UPI0024A83F91|nr:hypothetical protein [Halomonas kalidii]MDI5986014.1 hypothetical protein [Halomonas kalidii]